MKSIKPGRGPSLMGAVGSVMAVIFGIAWIGIVDNMGAPSFFTVFGIIFVIMGIANVIYNLTNVTSKNRFSTFDIVDYSEESDPLSPRDSSNKGKTGMFLGDRFCPFCGTKNLEEYGFCVKCGKELPKIN